MGRTLVCASLAQPLRSLLLACVLLATGARAFQQLPIDAFPVCPERRLAIGLWWPPARSLMRFGTLHRDDPAACLAVGAASLLALEVLKARWFRLQQRAGKALRARRHPAKTALRQGDHHGGSYRSRSMHPILPILPGPRQHSRRRRPVLHGLLAGLAIAAMSASASAATTPQQQMTQYAAQAGSVPDPTRGQQFFTGDHGHEWRCASCHGPVPVQAGQHRVTGKPIGAMAPAANPDRFTDAGKTEKWFRRNCHDVVGRECTPAEKADVIGWLLSLKP